MFSTQTVKLTSIALMLLIKSSHIVVNGLRGGETIRDLHQINIAPVADTYVRDGSKSDTNYGSREYLALRKSNNSDRKAVLKFDVGNQASLSDMSAKLRLHVDSIGSADSRTVTVKSLADTPDWEESTLTWNILHTINVEDVGTSFSVTDEDEDKWVEVDVSDLVENRHSNTLVLTLEIISPTNGGGRCDLSSKESTYAPQLILTPAGGGTPDPTQSPTPTPPVFTLGAPLLQGSGCLLESSVGVLATPDGSKVTVMFNDYWADTENDQKSRVRKNCAISIPVSILPGYSIGIFQADYRGYVYVPDVEGMEATFNAEYFFAGTIGPKQSTTWFHDSEEDFTLTDRVAAVAYSPCGHAEHNLRINTSILAKGLSSQDGGTVIQIDTADITNPYSTNTPLFSFGIYTKACSSSNARMFEP